MDFDDYNTNVANLISLNLKTGAKFKTEAVSKEFIRDMVP